MLWVLAALYILFEVWRGWRRGLVRHAISLAALLGAGIVGYGAAWLLAPLANAVLPFARPVNLAVTGLCAGLLIYAVAAVLSNVLFKRTAQQGSFVLRMIYGFGGALCGLCFALVVLWGGITLVRFAGAVAEGHRPAPDASADVVAPLDPLAPVAPGLAAAKDALEEGAAGKVVRKVDLLPTDVYRLVTKITRMSGSPEAMNRFLTWEGTQELLSTPKLTALLQDPSVARAAQERDYLGLLTNPRVIEVLNDPDLRRQAAAFDLEKALDYALASPPTSPIPAP